MFETDETHDEEESTENESDGPTPIPHGPPPENEEEPEENDEFDAAEAAEAADAGDLEDGDRADDPDHVEQDEEPDDESGGLGLLAWGALLSVVYFLLGRSSNDGNGGENDPYGDLPGV